LKFILSLLPITLGYKKLSKKNCIDTSSYSSYLPPFLVIVSFTATNAYFINRIPFSALRGLAVQQYRGEPLTSKVMTISFVD